ncbi:GH25 family lysozyme [Kitasatospora sp. NPDC048545]|uniref:GH25 family lysozyme n=1 Tax=Kitasatospora sp. NPDC048545 TaxID=3157208 RepID=UPI0033DB916C
MALARGYDVSDYQSSIPADAQFVFIKATEGARSGQQGYTAKLADARSRGLVVGHYHFIHCENPVQGEIDHFCQVVGAIPPGELLVLDFEPYGQPVSAGTATAAKNAWLAAVKQRYPNNRVGLYTSADWWRRTDDNAGDFLWIADYVQAGSPRIQAAWRFHQFTDTPLDMDVYNGSFDDLRAWAGGTVPQPVPPPTSGAPAAWTSPGRVPRAAWGAAAPTDAYTPMTGALGVKIHYLGEAYQFGDHSTCAAYVRKIQAAHMADPVQHWMDIAYNELVCEHGYRFEGRGHNVRSGANGNQTLNAQHYAICALVGSSGSTVPTDAQLQGLRDAIEDYQADAAAGPEIRGHKDGYQTDCPGGPLYTWIQAGAPRPIEEDDDMAARTDDEIIALVSKGVFAARDDVTWSGRHYDGDGSPSLLDLIAQIPAAVWEHGLPNVDVNWQQRAGDDALVPAKWLAAAANPLQIQLATARAQIAAQDAVVQTLLDRTSGVDTATVTAAIEAAVTKALVAGVDMHVTTTPTAPASKETS